MEHAHEHVSQAARTGIPRINPRRPRVLAASGLERIILGSDEGSRELARGHHAEAPKPLRSSAPALRQMLVLLHADRGAIDEHARQAIAAAALLADAHTGVVVAVLGGCNDDLGACGADAVIQLPEVDALRFCPDIALELAQRLVAWYQPLHIFLPDRDADADLGRRLAARSGAAIATDVVELEAGEGAALAMRVLPEGKVARCALPNIVLLARHAVDAKLPFVGHGRVTSPPAAGNAAPSPSTRRQVRDLGIEASSPDQIGLEEADFIVSAGNGMRDMATFNALAAALGAATGASRVAVDDGRFPRTKQIGATGKTVQASVYLALGISGAVQHLQGIKDCRHVIAVNLDDSVPLVKRADLTLVEDAQALMLALLALVQAARASKA